MTNTKVPGTAVITGASAGIGAIYADRLARRGYDIVMVARDNDRLKAVAESIKMRTGRAVGVIAADLNGEAGLAQVEERLRDDASIAMLVNNAGAAMITPLLESDIGRMTSMIGLNVTALMRLTAAVVPGMVNRGSGTLINISSAVAIGPERLNGVYGGTKAFVLAFSQSLRHELTGRGITVQVVMPGATATNLWALAGKPFQELPQERVMKAEHMVDAALSGLDQGEFATIPSLPDLGDWDAYEAARLAMLPKLSRATPAKRYLKANGVNAAPIET